LYFQSNSFKQFRAAAPQLGFFFWGDFGRGLPSLMLSSYNNPTCDEVFKGVTGGTKRDAAGFLGKNDQKRKICRFPRAAPAARVRVATQPGGVSPIFLNFVRPAACRSLPFGPV